MGKNRKATETSQASFARKGTINSGFFVETGNEPIHIHTVNGSIAPGVEEPRTSTVDALRELLKPQVTFEVGQVVSFRSRSRSYGNKQDYDYAAIFAGDHRWYLTGKNQYYGSGLTTSEFLEVLRKDDVHSVRLMTYSTTLK